jgi:DNA-binding MarR family transcriptional regulator
MENSQGIILLISQTLSLYRTRVNALFVQNNIDLTSEMSGILYYLWKSDRRKQGELADYFGKDKGGISKIIDNLEKRGLVTRESDPLDGRTKIVTLTQSGHDLENKVMPLINQVLNKMTSEISNRGLDTTKQILTDFVKHLK